MTAPGLEVNCGSKGDEHGGQGEVSKVLHWRQYAERRGERQQAGWERRKMREVLFQRCGEKTHKKGCTIVCSIAREQMRSWVLLPPPTL